MVSIKSLHIYPVKSLRGISLQEAKLTAKGLAHDRQFMLVNSDGTFVTQRQNSTLALIDTSVSDRGIILSRPGHGRLLLPFEESGETHAVIRTKVWGDDVETLDCGEEASDWISAAVNSSDAMRVVRMAPDFVRSLKARDRLGDETTTDFADAAPLTLVGEASLQALNEELNSRQQSTVPMNRFRPNIVVEGLGAFEEHTISSLEGRSYELQFRAHCQRCVMTTINQETAEKDPGGEPFKTLQDINPTPDKPKAPAFAHYVTVVSGLGNTIRVGDTLE